VVALVGRALDRPEGAAGVTHHLRDVAASPSEGEEQHRGGEADEAERGDRQQDQPSAALVARLDTRLGRLNAARRRRCARLLGHEGRW
jgi:hypothetical protein